jgi:hypothetical protein
MNTQTCLVQISQTIFKIHEQSFKIPELLQNKFTIYFDYSVLLSALRLPDYMSISSHSPSYSSVYKCGHLAKGSLEYSL